MTSEVEDEVISNPISTSTLQTKDIKELKGKTENQEIPLSVPISLDSQTIDDTIKQITTLNSDSSINPIVNSSTQIAGMVGQKEELLQVNNPVSNVIAPAVAQDVIIEESVSVIEPYPSSKNSVSKPSTMNGLNNNNNNNILQNPEITKVDDPITTPKINPIVEVQPIDNDITTSNESSIPLNEAMTPPILEGVPEQAAAATISPGSSLPIPPEQSEIKPESVNEVSQEQQSAEIVESTEGIEPNSNVFLPLESEGSVMTLQQDSITTESAVISSTDNSNVYSGWGEVDKIPSEVTTSNVTDNVNNDTNDPTHSPPSGGNDVTPDAQSLQEFHHEQNPKNPYEFHPTHKVSFIAPVEVVDAKPYNSRLFIGNLAPNAASKADIARVFAKYGDIIEILIKPKVMHFQPMS